METWKLFVILFISIFPWGVVGWYGIKYDAIKRYANKLLDELDAYWDGTGGVPSGRKKP